MLHGAAVLCSCERSAVRPSAGRGTQSNCSAALPHPWPKLKQTAQGQRLSHSLAGLGRTEPCARCPLLAHRCAGSGAVLLLQGGFCSYHQALQQAGLRLEVTESAGVEQFCNRPGDVGLQVQHKQEVCVLPSAALQAAPSQPVAPLGAAGGWQASKSVFIYLLLWKALTFSLVFPALSSPCCPVLPGETLLPESSLLQ